MTIAEQITQLKTDFDEVKQAGYEKGKSEGGNTEEAYNNGKLEERKAFWDAYQVNGNRTDYQHAFRGVGWNDTNFYPEYDIICQSGPVQMFCGTYITDIKGRLEELNKTIDFSQAKELNGIFYGSHSERLPVIDCSSCNKFISTFGSAYLKSIDGLLNIKETATFNGNEFYGSSELTDIHEISGTIGATIKLGSCQKLSVKTARRIIGVLRKYAGTENEGKCYFYLDGKVWTNLNDTTNEDYTAPPVGADGTIYSTWQEYVQFSLGWGI